MDTKEFEKLTRLTLPLPRPTASHIVSQVQERIDLHHGPAIIMLYRSIKVPQTQVYTAATGPRLQRWDIVTGCNNKQCLH